MNILVTGAAGFIGSHLFDHLLSLGENVWGIDNYSIGTYKHPRIKRLDLMNKKATDLFMRQHKFELVYHLAAWAHEGLSQFCPIKITENNYNIYCNLLVPAIRYGLQRIVVTSSMSVYGNQRPPFTEDMPMRPCDVYAVAKSSVEEITKILSHVYDFEYVILRPHNVYGPRQVLHDPYRNVVGIFINRMLAKKQFYIYGDGGQKRSFSYIDDVIPTIACAGWRQKASGETINIGPLEKYTINQLAREVMKHFPNAKSPIYLKDRPLEVKDAWCSNDKAMRLLSYETNTTFSDGIKHMVEWARTVGYQKPRYLEELELEGDATPETWRKKLI